MHIGLVLSGGMGKGAYQVGALTAIDEFFSPSDFEYVSAASVGVLNAYAYLTNNLLKATEIWKTVNINREKYFVMSALKSNILQDIITTIVSSDRITNNFYAPLFDLKNKELSYYNLKNRSPEEADLYLRASIAIPFYNKGVLINGKFLYDGAVVDNIPIYPVLKNDLDYVICIYFDDFNYIFENYATDSKIIKLTFPDDKIISNSINADPDAISYMMSEGYNRTKQILLNIFSEGTTDLKAVYKKIQQVDSQNGTEKVRITGDVIVTNLNKMIKRLVRHKKILEEDNNE